MIVLRFYTPLQSSEHLNALNCPKLDALITPSSPLYDVDSLFIPEWSSSLMDSRPSKDLLCFLALFHRDVTFTCRNCGGGDTGRVAIYCPFGEVSLSLNRTVTCMVLKANDRRTSCPFHDEFRGPRSDYVRQVALATTT
ncbi:uncharacterized protein TNCV_4942941 [Trichonephila clavipes]|nr:uncharacterized protein TNCV_4942941 [Trichonephila clavipes]